MGQQIKLTASDGFQLGGYRADPAGTPKGAVVVIQEIFGVNHHIRNVCDRFASAGYVAVAPAIFDRSEPNFQSGYSADEVAVARKFVANPDWAAMLLDVQAAIDSVKDVGPVGIVGFCLGGLSSQLGHKLDGKVGSLRPLIIVWSAAVGICLAASVSPGWLGVALLMVGGTCLYGVAAPRVSEAVNRHVDSSRRATVLSTQSLLVSLMFIPVSAVMGQVSSAYGVRMVLVAIACWLGVAGLALVAWCFSRRRINARRLARIAAA